MIMHKQAKINALSISLHVLPSPLIYGLQDASTPDYVHKQLTLTASSPGSSRAHP